MKPTVKLSSFCAIKVKLTGQLTSCQVTAPSKAALHSADTPRKEVTVERNVTLRALNHDFYYSSLIHHHHLSQCQKTDWGIALLSGSNKDSNGYKNITEKVKLRCFKLCHAHSISFNSLNVGNFSSGKEKESRCPVFTSSTKCEIRHYQIAVMQ